MSGSNLSFGLLRALLATKKSDPPSSPAPSEVLMRRVWAQFSERLLDPPWHEFVASQYCIAYFFTGEDGEFENVPNPAQVQALDELRTTDRQGTAGSCHPRFKPMTTAELTYAATCFMSFLTLWLLRTTSSPAMPPPDHDAWKPESETKPLSAADPAYAARLANDRTLLHLLSFNMEEVERSQEWGTTPRFERYLSDIERARFAESSLGWAKIETALRDAVVMIESVKTQPPLDGLVTLLSARELLDRACDALIGDIHEAAGLGSRSGKKPVRDWALERARAVFIDRVLQKPVPTVNVRKLLKNGALKARKEAFDEAVLPTDTLALGRLSSLLFDPRFHPTIVAFLDTRFPVK
ncbi:MAG: hypothetical protein KIS66_02305 [Fimbriimonadaceae bacterium]|nr:hypothetical protein [Fimbriimonadaceae bacterium]